MAAGTLFTVLGKIPWKAVIENAPRLAAGTVTLWNTVSGWKKSRPTQNEFTDAPIEDTALTDEALLNRLQALETSVTQLHEQMQMSSELLKSLAEQNIKLVERAELNRRRVVRLTRVAVGLIVGLLAVIVYLFVAR